MKTKIIYHDKPSVTAKSLEDGEMARVVSTIKGSTVPAEPEDVLLKVQGCLLNLTRTTFIAEVYWPSVNIEFLSNNDTVELRP